jgi:hypothetical protein
MHFTGANVTSDAGLQAFAELDRAVNLTLMANVSLKESRPGKHIRHRLLQIIRQAVAPFPPAFEEAVFGKHARVIGGSITGGSFGSAGSTLHDTWVSSLQP